MMNVRIVALGRLKEKYLSEAVREYEKRLSAFCRFEVVEIEPERLPESPSDAQIKAALETEADKIISKLPKDGRVIALCVEGKQLSSEALAERISEQMSSGTGITFVIGSSCGLSFRIKQAADMRLSMSEMTFPHQLARVMLCEQIYRAFTIINHRKYHK